MQTESSLIQKHPLLFYIRTNKRPFALGIFFLVLTNLFDGISPFIIKTIIDQIIEGLALTEVSKNIFIYFMAMVFLAFSRYGWRYFFGTYHTLAAENLRNVIFKKFLGLDQAFFTRSPVGELMSLITNDVNSFRQAIGPSLLILLDAVFMATMILPFMIIMNPEWTWKTMVFLPLVPFMIWQVMQLIYKYFKAEQDKFAELSGYSQESVAGIRPIKGFVQNANRLNKYNTLSKEYELSCNKTSFVDSLFAPVMEFGVAAGTVILLFIAAPDMMTGTVTIGTFVAFQRYIEKMVWPMTALGIGLSNFQKGMASFERIKDVLKVQPAIIDDGSLKLEKVQTIEFKNVSYMYPGATTSALKDISFILHAGDKLGILGPVGSGKTTLIQLLLRFIEPTQGEILINGLNINKYRLSSIRNTLCVVPQEPFLFSTSLKKNILYGIKESEISDAEVLSLADTVCLKDEIEKLPHRLSTELGEKGVNLSGGQKQRMTMARALALEPEFLILDDSLSAVDVHTEKKIVESVISSSQFETLLVVTHRLPVIMSMNRLLVLKDGRLEAEGNPQTLWQTSLTFKNMAQLQDLKEGQL